ncbi:hypothetical protein N7448_000632 [Penicillium atrosanguineum]|uniref:Uncharacterized protein n=1 Tax=Penicillium atrosanguineum TaxID=1132637 RepID=A0A9W9LCU1_9EURO|nr:uncharacterized protein N7443_004027 [Penicillium atrosanguineum]KAJ5134345.1 hypothetical protein N7526_005710 [Penicillium atrosanguineum]KAJ5149054.1 hypothetical protein N7448_000632 [Penicillium atrosanguineum]KAJ5304367.1 hypothetical protein N7443_004027 [Penicillium atrosanguineum]KAJ5323840.1 hypothetical protein N7476_002440 [Penicillium atrosanguineum]
MQRQIPGTLDVRFVDCIKQDVLDHRNDPEYDILYLAPVPNSKHNFHVRIEDLQSLDIDSSAQWSQRLMTAYAHIDQRHPLGSANQDVLGIIQKLAVLSFLLSAALVQGATISGRPLDEELEMIGDGK